MPSNNERYPLSHEFLSIANILNKICFGELKSIEFGNGLLTVKRLISDDTNYEKILENAITRIMELEDEIKLLRTIFKKSTYKKITEVYVDHKDLLQEQPSSQIQYNSSTPKENTNNSSLSFIIVDLGIKQGDSDEST
ncbi:hypothetical protein C2G38_2256683 [Gigaspora rosea]|uniref:Uncharacterized protein n=1 Tax=Gigaspora rosea TaxID=44941 RepID=A0A397U067_9GLOM|nr:hypothetical protein C2G38_2256683 [Gigaspora rosea]